MPLTEDDLFWVRSQIGSATPPSDLDLDDAYDRLGTKEEVALEVLEGRYAGFLSSPLKWSLDGDMSVDYGPNVKMLAGEINRLRTETGSGHGLLYRTDRER